ncbi:MAG: BACON domain-containing protein, partial [Acidobacteriota bacterium]|nr:BACON domain-containing protein [Acidobacteriota bacterium]
MRKAARAGAFDLPRAAGALAAGTLLLFSLSCGSSSEILTTPSQPRCGLEAQAEQQVFAPDGGSGSIRITTARECSWSVRTESAWVRLATPAAGQGAGVVQFTVAANADPASRAAAVTVEDRQL